MKSARRTAAIGAAVLLALTGCVEQRKFWKEVDQDKSAQVPYDASADQKPNEE